MSDLFSSIGLHVLAGGQFGSEGKGLLASWLAKQAVEEDWFPEGVITSAGPNSGHTSYFGDEKIVLKQLPTFAVHMHLRGTTVPVYFSAGAIIDDEVLMAEHLRYPGIPIFVHTNAAMVRQRDKEEESNPEGSIFRVAGTRSGTGAAIARKVHRDERSIYYNYSQRLFPYYSIITNLDELPYFMEISQGFSLGINSEFYPHVTSRECTFMQGMADARISPRHYSKGYLCFRTLPIRVGNADGYSSGDWYQDQDELTWDKVGVKPELTTVTKRERRIATFSWRQFREAMEANCPTHVFMNFMEYLNPAEQRLFCQKHREFRDEQLFWYEFIHGFGTGVDDVIYKGSSRAKTL